MLEVLTQENYDRLSRLGDVLRDGLRALFTEAEQPAQITGLGSLIGIHLTQQPVNNYRDAQT